MRRSPSITRTLGAVVALCLAGSVSVAGDGSTSSAAADQPDVVIVGDSLTGGNVSYIAPTLRSAGIDADVQGLSARRIAVSFSFQGYRDSGVERVRTLRAANVDPTLWVIQLGTNDLGVVENCRCPDRRAFAGDLIDKMVAEIGPDQPIAWVTLVDRARPAIAAAFNEALDDRAIRNPFLTTIRWNEVARGRPEWFLDDVHPNLTGIAAFAAMYVREIQRLLDDLPGSVPAPTEGPQRATRLGFVFDR